MEKRRPFQSTLWLKLTLSNTITYIVYIYVYIAHKTLFELSTVVLSYAVVVFFHMFDSLLFGFMRCLPFFSIVLCRSLSFSIFCLCYYAGLPSNRSNWVAVLKLHYRFVLLLFFFVLLFLFFLSFFKLLIIVMRCCVVIIQCICVHKRTVICLCERVFVSLVSVRAYMHGPLERQNSSENF